jgi:serine/threonine protein kinase
VSDAIESLPPGTLPVLQGDVLAGKYRVERVLGLGGMGVVVVATHMQLDQKVALKFMLPDALQHPSLVERFAREARAAVRLKSDHVARVLDVGTLHTGSPYMVMEYLEGSDLGTMIERQGPMTVELAVDCVLQACDAVAEAHSIGIVHRDLKPRNLFMTGRNDGRALVKVLDFGISKHTASADLSLTRTTEVIGSPNYMSPEQLKSSKGVDERSDIWALGVVLYELIAGQVPFVAESVTQLTAMVLTEAPRSIRSLRADVPRELAGVIERCLEKSPQSRFASVAELALALQPFAPADSRDLAVRIARIASASGRSPTPAPAGTASASARTSANWSDSGSRLPGGPPVLAIVLCAALGGGALLVGALVFMRHERTPPLSAPATPAAAAVPNASPIASASAIPHVALPPLTPMSTLAPAPTLSSTPAPTPAPPIKKLTRDKGAASAASAPDESPRYRTNW